MLYLVYLEWGILDHSPYDCSRLGESFSILSRHRTCQHVLLFYLWWVVVASFLKQVSIQYAFDLEDVKWNRVYSRMTPLALFSPKQGHQWGFTVLYLKIAVSTWRIIQFACWDRSLGWQSDFWYNVLCFRDTRWRRMWLLHWSCQHQGLMKNFCVKLKQFLSLWRTWHSLAASNKPDGQKPKSSLPNWRSWRDGLYHCCSIQSIVHTSIIDRWLQICDPDWLLMKGNDWDCWAFMVGYCGNYGMSNEGNMNNKRSMMITG